jgi:hypothetical protein
MSEFDYFSPTVLQSSILAEYDEAIGPVNTIQPNVGCALGPFEFNIPGASDLYRDLNNSYLKLTLKVTNADNSNLANDAVLAPVNLVFHSLFKSVSVTICGKEITEKDSLYPYRAYMETLLTYDSSVLKARAAVEGWSKDTAGRMNNISLLATDTPPANEGFVARRKLIDQSRPFTLCGRPHVDLFHTSLDIPPSCPMTIKFSPSTVAFAFMGANANAGCKVVVMAATLFVRTKRVCPELVMAHREMLQKCNIRIPLNRVTVSRYAIPQGFSAANVTLNFPAKLPKRLFIGFVTNTSCTGALDENPYNFKHVNVTDIQVSVNGTSIPNDGLEMNYTTGDYQRAYLNTFAALGLDNSNRSIDLKASDFAEGYAIYGFKLAPGPIDGTVFTAANSVGSVVATVKFSAGLAAATDMIVYAETPAVLEIDKLSAATLV